MSLEYLQEQASIARAVTRLERKKGGLRAKHNRQVVAAGSAAVSDGLFTPDNVVAKTRETINRHLGMMTSLGLPDLQELERNTKEFDVWTVTIGLQRRVGVSLRQKAHGHNAHGFRPYAQQHGLETALADFATPASTAVVLEDTRNRGRAAKAIVLGPTEFSDPDSRFREEWGRDFFPFGPEFDGTAIDNSSLARGEARYLRPNGLIIAAGYNVVFNNVLDEVEARLES